MTVFDSDAALTRAMAEILYYRSVAGFGRDTAPPWMDCPQELRDHWSDIARLAVSMVRTADQAATNGAPVE